MISFGFHVLDVQNECNGESEMNTLIHLTDEELRNHILPFWMNLVDHEFGGFYGKVNSNHELDKNYFKGSIVNSRILWAFSASFNRYKEPEYLQSADHAFNFLKDHFLDHKFDGLYLSVDYKGNPLDKRKHINTISYALYALVEYYIASNKIEVKDQAISFFNLIESKKNQYGYYQEEFDEKWVKKPNEFLDRFELHAEYTLNNYLHILESYSQLYNIWPEKILLNKIENLLGIFETKLFNKTTNFFDEFFDKNWTSLTNLVNYGHNIEGSWLLSRALEITGLENKNIVNIIENICKSIKHEAFHKNAVILEKHNNNYNRIRMWWVQTEAVIGFLNAYQLFGDESFLNVAQSIWEFLRNKFIDKTPNGEWFAGLSDDMEVLSEYNMVDQWKGPYHNTRMCIEVSKRLSSK